MGGQWTGSLIDACIRYFVHFYIYLITKICPCIIQICFSAVMIENKIDIFNMSAQNIDCGYKLIPPRRGGSNEYQQY